MRDTFGYPAKKKEGEEMYSALRKKNHLSCKELAEKMKADFPAANAGGVSLAERPLESGVTYTAEARRFIKKLCGVDEKEQGRKDKARLNCWLPEETKKAFINAKAKRGFLTDHDYIIFLIMQDIARIEKAARSDGAEQGGKEKNLNSIIAEMENLSNDR